MAYSLWPGYIRINYQTTKSLHSMTIPTRAPEGSGAGLDYMGWNGLLLISFPDMVQNLVAGLVPSFPTDTTFLDATAYRVLTEESEAAVPIAFHVITDGAGTSLAGGVDAAQATWSFMTELGHQARIVGLDIGPSVEFRPRQPGGFVAADTALEAALSDVESAWAGRDGSRPVSLRRVIFTLNDALRRAYKYT